MRSNLGLALDPLTPLDGWYDNINHTNRFTAEHASYDAHGNLTGLGPSVVTMTYDGADMIKSAAKGSTTATYDYDGEGRRVRKLTSAGQSTDTIYVYDAFGRLATEYSTASVPTGREYYTSDHLGSTRLVTDDSASVVRRRYDYIPFGEEIPQGVSGRSAKYPLYSGSLDGQPQKFTGKERDAETGLDYFGARYFSAPQGRFTSVDPYSSLGLHLSDPQGWNGYSYARNNPLLFVDPDGNDYRVCEYQNGNEFNCGIVNDDRAFSEYAQKMGWDIKGGKLIDKEGNVAGTAHWFSPEAMETISLAGQLAAPAGQLLTAGLRAFGYVAAPQLMTIADYASGVDRSTSNVVTAIAPILIPEERLAHVLDSHTLGGVLSAGKSLFNAGEDVKGLIQAAESAPAKSVGNVLIHTVDAGRIIGMDRNTQQATSIYTVITKNTGELITAHPGKP